MCLVLATALELTPGLIWKYIVDEVVGRRITAALLPAVGLLVVVHALDGLLSAVRGRLLESVGQHFVFDLRNRLYEKLGRLPIAYFDDARTGDLMSRLGADVEAVQDVVIRGTDSVVANALRLVGVAVIFCSLNLKLGLATLVPILVVGALLRVFSARVRGVYRAAREKLGTVNAKLQDNLAGIRVIKAFAREEAEAAAFRSVTTDYLQENLRAVKTRTTFFPFVRWIASWGNTIMIGYGAFLILQNEFTLGGLVAFRSYGRYFFGPIDDLTQISDTVQRAVAAGDRLFEVLDAPLDTTDLPGARPLGPIRGQIVFDHVSFRYRPDTLPVLNDVSFRIEPGQVVALVGASGVGKSTIFALLGRFWDPEDGRVLVDGQSLTTVTQQSLRQQIVGVAQETFLFTASVRDNIRYARPDASDAEVEAAARAANAHAFISALPQGYDTSIGERGVKLSGGQRQRLALARAFLADGRVLLLDEATSAVEPESEQIIQEALERLMRGRTTLIATHRLGTIRHADLILVLAEGRVVEQGTHRELMRRAGAYARMIVQQQGKDAAFGYPPIAPELPLANGSPTQAGEQEGRAFPV